MDLPTRLTPVSGSDHLYLWSPGGAGLWGYANCLWIISGDEAAVVDTPYDRPMTEAMIAAARPWLGDRPVRTVVNTHANGDHSFGNHLFPGAEIVATEAARVHQHHEPTPADMHALLHASPPDSPMGWYVRRHFGGFDFTSGRVTPATTTFSGQHSFAVGDEEVHLYEVGPAHHDGDLVVRVGDVVCTGDIFFHGDHPAHWAGPLQNVIDACERVLRLDPRVVVPGHGEVTTADELAEHVGYLRAVQREARLRHEAGIPLEKAVDDLIGQSFYPLLGLPERLMIVLGVEYAHLSGAGAAPGVVELAGKAAAWSFGRRDGARVAPVSA